MAEDPKRVAVIGGGWAGCAAAVELTHAGKYVTLYEATRSLGGRARRIDMQGMALDNGQHILIGAYTESLRLMRQVGVNPDEAMLRVPLQMRYPPDTNGMDFIAPKLPAPFHLLFALIKATGLMLEDKLALARFMSAARWMGWQLHNDCSVSELLERFEQTSKLNRLLWVPLCVSALNTPPETASAKVFLSVLRDSLGSKRGASDMLVPRVDFTALFPEKAASYIERHGGIVKRGQAVREIAKTSAGWNVEGRQYDAVVIATASLQAAALLQKAGADLPFSFDYEPITTCYLYYEQQPRLAQPFYALPDDPEAGKWGQFVFDRGWLNEEQKGLMAVVVSASAGAVTQGQESIEKGIANQLAEVLKQPELAQPTWMQSISERHATFACTPDLERPDNETGLEGLVLAGDYTQSDYPATLEAAVRSGVRAASLLCR